MGAFTKVVAAGAKLMCTAGSAPSFLLATTASGIRVEGKMVATIFDGKPFTNIPPFGTCSIKGGPCIPSMPGPWAPSFPPGADAIAAPMLPFDATLPCAMGGMIRVADCNQASLMIGGKGQAELSAGPGPEERAAMDEYEERMLDLWGTDEAKRIHEDELSRRVTTAQQDEQKARTDYEAAARKFNKSVRGLAGSAAAIAQRRQELRTIMEDAARELKRTREARERNERSLGSFRNRGALARIRTRARR
jgi:hypothetical protein